MGFGRVFFFWFGFLLFFPFNEDGLFFLLPKNSFFSRTYALCLEPLGLCAACPGHFPHLLGLGEKEIST